METYEIPTEDKERHVYEMELIGGSTSTQKKPNYQNVQKRREKENRKKTLGKIIILSMVVIGVLAALSFLVHVNMKQTDLLKTIIDRSEDAKQLTDKLVHELHEVGMKVDIISPEFLPIDCGYYKELNDSVEDGVYQIYPMNERSSFPAYCDMTTDGGGWTVFQRRVNGTVDFYRDWDNYTDGFGNLNGEFWLGNEQIHLLTSTKKYELRIDLGDWNGLSRYALYSSFSIGNKVSEYPIKVSGYSGDAGDSLKNSNGYRFSTKDNDNDGDSGTDCAEYAVGAWWYKICGYSNLNGEYLMGKNSKGSSYRGMSWYHWTGWQYSLKQSKMMIRRK